MMESLVNYGSDEENDTSSPSKETGGAYGPARSNNNEDNYDAVVMDMSEKLLNHGSKPPPMSGFKSCSAKGSPDSNCSIGLDSNASSRSSQKQQDPVEMPIDDRRKEKERDAGSRRDHHERSRSPSGLRKDQERSRSGRDRHHKEHDRKDRGRDRERERDRDSERDRERNRGRDRDDRHGSRRDDKRKKSRSRSRSGSRSPSGSPRSSDRHRRDRKRNHRKDQSPPNSKSRGDAESRSSGSRQSTNRANARPGGFYSKINNKINVLERLGIALKPTDSSVNPQTLAQRAVEQQAAQVKLASGIEISSYLNPAATQRFAEQMHKKRLLWGARPKEESTAPKPTDPMSSKWQGTTFAQDHDGKVAAKFNRLMGIKGAPEKEEPKPGVKKAEEIIKKQEEMFHNMESQYEVARLATHTHRGLGLGFGTFQPR